MADFCDGELYSSHLLYMVDENALQLIPYYDEVEPFNNLGSASGKYKLGIHVHACKNNTVYVYMHVYGVMAW